MTHYLASHSLSQPSSSQSAHPVVRVLRTVESVLGSAMNTLLIWNRRHRDRLHLTGLDERMRRDIGVTGTDVAHEAAKPFWRA